MKRTEGSTATLGRQKRKRMRQSVTLAEQQQPVVAALGLAACEALAWELQSMFWYRRRIEGSAASRGIGLRQLLSLRAGPSRLSWLAYDGASVMTD